MAKKCRTYLDQQEVRLRWANRRLSRLENENKQLKQVAYYDELTRESAVLSRYGFMEHMKARATEIDDRTRRGESRQNALLFIDLDKFKAVNDKYGHEAGDIVLQAFASAVQSVLRGSDVIGRIGGDEFAVVARVSKNAGLLRLKYRIEQAIALVSVVYQGTKLPVSASVGGALFRSDEGNGPNDIIKKTLRRADEDMYYAKRTKGRRDRSSSLL